jgi:hypothetical protein
MAIIATCIVKILMHLSPWYRLQQVCEAVSHIIAIFSLYMLLTIHPFDFTPINRIEINTLLQFAFTIAIIALCIAFLMTCFRILRGKAS